MVGEEGGAIAGLGGEDACVWVACDGTEGETRARGDGGRGGHAGCACVGCVVGPDGKPAPQK